MKKGTQKPFKGMLSAIVMDLEHQSKPKNALEQLKVKANKINLTNHKDKPDDKQVKSLDSSLKSKHKKYQEADLSVTA